MNQLIPFKYQDTPVRTIMKDGEPWFVAKDICDILEIGNSRQALTRLSDDEKGVTQTDTLGGSQNLSVINEPGLYVLVLRSDKPQAEPFRRWVTHEVLPQLRKTGSYSVEQLTGEELMARALLEARQVMEKKDQLLQEQHRQIRNAAPKVEYVDTFVADSDLTTIRDIANQLNIGEQRLRRILEHKKWIYKREYSYWSNTQGQKVTERQWKCYAEKKTYFHLVPHHRVDRLPGGDLRQTLKVTPRGAVAIARLIKKLESTLTNGNEAA